MYILLNALNLSRKYRVSVDQPLFDNQDVDQMYQHIDYNSIIVIAIFQHGTGIERLLEECLLKAAMLIPLIDPLNHFRVWYGFGCIFTTYKKNYQYTGCVSLSIFFRVKTLVQWHFPSVSEAILKIWGNKLHRSTPNKETLIWTQAQQTREYILWDILLPNHLGTSHEMDDHSANLIYSLKIPKVSYLSHWGQVTHICVGNLTTIGSDNGLSPDRHQAIIGTNAGILLIGP